MAAIFRKGEGGGGAKRNCNWFFPLRNGAETMWYTKKNTVMRRMTGFEKPMCKLNQSKSGISMGAKLLPRLGYTILIHYLQVLFLA